MRTDSLRLSEEALAAARSYITAHYGEAFCPASPNRYKARAGAQDAHEAIRPTNAALAPEHGAAGPHPRAVQLYRLIWGRFTACQMANAVYDNVTVEPAAPGTASARAIPSSSSRATPPSTTTRRTRTPRPR